MKSAEIVNLWGGAADARRPRRGPSTRPRSCSHAPRAWCRSWSRSSSNKDGSTMRHRSRYWPEFAQNGEGRDHRARKLLGHQAGLSALTTELEFDDLPDWDRVVGHPSAPEAPLWPPGTGYTYHAAHPWLARRRSSCGASPAEGRSRVQRSIAAPLVCLRLDRPAADTTPADSLISLSRPISPGLWINEELSSIVRRRQTGPIAQ